MKVKASVKRMCKDCKIVHRNGRVAVTCSSLANGGRHKQRQG